MIREQLAYTNSLLTSLGRLQDEAVEHAAEVDEATARSLDRHGPIVQGLWRYEGACIGGLWTVIRTPDEGFPPEPLDDMPPQAGAHAAVCITEDDGEVD
jgi:hypothetical protein